MGIIEDEGAWKVVLKPWRLRSKQAPQRLFEDPNKRVASLEEDLEALMDAKIEPEEVEEVQGGLRSINTEELKRPRHEEVKRRHEEEEHLKFRNDCRVCIEGQAKSRPHRRVANPERQVLCAEQAS